MLRELIPYVLVDRYRCFGRTASYGLRVTGGSKLNRKFGIKQNAVVFRTAVTSILTAVQMSVLNGDPFETKVKCSGPAGDIYKQVLPMY